MNDSCLVFSLRPQPRGNEPRTRSKLSQRLFLSINLENGTDRPHHTDTGTRGEPERKTSLDTAKGVGRWGGVVMMRC